MRISDVKGEENIVADFISRNVKGTANIYIICSVVVVGQSNFIVYWKLT